MSRPKVGAPLTLQHVAAWLVESGVDAAWWED